MKFLDTEGRELLELATSNVAPGRARAANVQLGSEDLTGVVISDVVFEGGDFDGAKMKGARISNVEFEGAWLCDVDWSSSSFGAVRFYDVQAYGAIFRGANLRDTTFSGCNLANIDLSLAKLEAVRFQPDNVNHATDLSGANLSDVDLSATTFIDVLYDKDTRFPAGFDPKKRRGLTEKRS